MPSWVACSTLMLVMPDSPIMLELFISIYLRRERYIYIMIVNCKWFCPTKCDFPSLTWIARGRVFDAMPLNNCVSCEDSPVRHRSCSKFLWSWSKCHGVWLCQKIGCLPNRPNNGVFNNLPIFFTLKPISWTSIWFSQQKKSPGQPCFSRASV